MIDWELAESGEEPFRIAPLPEISNLRRTSLLGGGHSKSQISNHG